MLLKNTFFKAFFFLSLFAAKFVFSEYNNSSLEYQLNELSKEEDQNKRLHQLFDLYWNWCLKEHPEEATFLGYDGRHDQWSDLSFKAIQQHDYFATLLLRVLHTIHSDQLEEEDKISYNILKKLIEDDRIYTQFGDPYLLINQMDGIHLHAFMVIEMMPTQSVEDYQNILSRLRNLPTLFQQTIDLLERGIELGITPPMIAIRKVPEQILNQLVEDPIESPLLQGFKSFPSSIPADTQVFLLEEAKIVYLTKTLPMLKQFYKYITDRYLPNCRKTIAFQDLPQGKEWYEHKIQSSTTTSLTPIEIHQIGLKEVDRIYQEILEIIDAINFKGSYEEFLDFLKKDPQFLFTSREEILEEYKKLTREIESKLPKLFKKLPIQPFEVIPIPQYAEESQVTAYYCHGSLKDHRPGYFFINTSFPHLRPKWEMEPLALHEAVPGHHLQIALAQELDNLPEFRKHVHFTSYVEGWGLYAERLGLELGLYQNPYSAFGRLSYEMLRAIRLVVDTGMHALGWSRDEAIEFFKKYVGLSDHEIITEVDRYLVMPGQALAYKIGELKIQEMRQKSSSALGDQFDVREFHHEWLKNGTVPLDIAEEKINYWIKQSLNRSTHKDSDFESDRGLL